MTNPNVAAWTQENAEYTDGRAEQAWARDEITFGIWNVPESELHALPDLAGKDVVELGCGTAYFGAWLKKAGAARVVGVDPTPAQLETARRCNVSTAAASSSSGEQRMTRVELRRKTRSPPGRRSRAASGIHL